MNRCVLCAGEYVGSARPEVVRQGWFCMRQPCVDRVHAELEKMKPGQVWSWADYFVVLDLLQATAPAEPSTP